MRNRNFFYAVIVAFLIGACGNDSAKPAINVDSISAENKDSNLAGKVIGGPLALTDAELRDDALFSDGSIPTSWINAGITDSVKVKKFIRQLQVWVADSKPDSIAKYLLYPVKNPGIPDPQNFLKNYETYFNESVRSAVMSQNLSQVFRNQQGVMLGEGRVWLTEKDNNILIIAINN